MTVAISMTDFVDFVNSAGTPKLTKVREIKRRPDYDPATDFWRPLRRILVAFHKAGETNKKILDRALDGVSDPKKVDRYTECIAGYKRFLGRKKHEWLTPERSHWETNGLAIRVNPELTIRLDGAPHNIKLYFKRDKLSRRRVDTLLALMAAALTDSAAHAVLDVPRGKLYTTSKASPNEILPLLAGESSSFATIYNALP